MSKNRIPPLGPPTPAIQNTKATQDAPAKKTENRLNIPALPLPNHTSPTANRFQHQFKSEITSRKAPQPGPGKSGLTFGKADDWYSGHFERHLMTADRFGQMRFIRQASTNTAATGMVNDPAGVKHTDYLRNTARLLYNANVNDNQLDASQLDRVIKELRSGPAWNERSAQCVDMERALRSLRDDKELREFVNSIGANRW